MKLFNDNCQIVVAVSNVDPNELGNDGINIMVFDRETQGLVGEFCFTPDGFGNLIKKYI